MINMVMARGLVQFSIIVIIELWKKDLLLDEYMYFLFAGVLPQQVFNDRQHFRLFVAEILMPSTVQLFIK